jgi:hypothetical protein
VTSHHGIRQRICVGFSLAIAGWCVSLGIAGSVPAAAAASCNGGSHAVTLDSGRVSPGTGGTSTRFVFSVRLRDNAGCAPTKVEVVIQGYGRYRLTGTGNDYRGGVIFSGTARVPVGRWTYSFYAEGGSGAGARTVNLLAVSPSSITVTAPPRPTATPRPPATPRPTPRPAPRPSKLPTVAVVPNPSPPPATPAPSTSERPALTPEPSSSGSMWTADSNPAAGDEGTAPGPLGPPSGVVIARSAGTSARASGSGLSIRLGFDATPVLAWTCASLLGVALFAGLVSRPGPVRPRRFEFAPLAGIEVGGLPLEVSRDSRARPERTDQAVAVNEAQLPRWLRPSVGAARQPSGLDERSVREPIRFGTPARARVERRTVSHRLVRLADAPHEHDSHEIGRLDLGDEVEILDVRNGFARVRVPGGQEGWIPAMTTQSMMPAGLR